MKYVPNRRHFNTFQRCELGYNYKPHYEQMANRNRGKRTDLVSEFRHNVEEENEKTRSKIADEVG